MDDLINRQAAIDAICEECHMETDYHRCEGYKKDSRWCEYSTALNDLPSAQPEPQWIPCSERPPKEEDGRVLITLDGEVTTAIYSEFSKIWYIGDMCGVSDRVPTAWMPRPKPYRSK